MAFDHDRLDVYQCALEFLSVANGIVERLPRGRAHLADQLSRASTSIVLNIAEGAGRRADSDKRRFYITARGSATESAAILDVCSRLHVVSDPALRDGKALLERIVSMLVKLARSCEPTEPE